MFINDIIFVNVMNELIFIQKMKELKNQFFVERKSQPEGR
uniref:Uncharacterized protein n=1 Tax=Pithovirus LCPAC201 TaxID=2506591 RepID=A0A481Z506_9VIRU|nr:MAG: hypothetical protein LCPAC201_02740 [Pithovirus LCPAC201]